MGLYNFEARFVPYIKAGKKRHTIRARRKNPDRPGKTMYLYSGLRTKNAKLIMKTHCTRVEQISITTDQRVYINGVQLDGAELQQLARTDGFESFTEMMNYWREKDNLPFAGDIIHWSAR
jgi:hypothetical protein